jgi:leucyl-tRNA synthetase
MEYEPADIEARWRERWAESGRYEADPGEAEPTFVTVPYPYPSGGMHLGHARTYTVPDVYARYRRLQGDNVLFPIAWHVTGTPIVGAVERLEKREQDQLDTLQTVFGVPDSDLDKLETPMSYAEYFIEDGEASYKRGMQSLGLSIDWRREFTTNDDRYSKFITWQYETLRERGLLEEGLHPVKYCTNEGNPVTTHDLLEGENAEFQEYTLVRFAHDDTVVPMATLRPETVRGVTNAYVHPEASYVRATVRPLEPGETGDGADKEEQAATDGGEEGAESESEEGAESEEGETDASGREEWLISEEAVEKFRLQAYDVTVEERFAGEEFVGESVTNPVTDEEVPVLPAMFVDPDNATGVVMSVPAHSPDDYLALQEAQADTSRLDEFDIDPAEVESIEPVPVLEVDEYGEIPARDAVEAAGVESADDPELEAVTADLYQDEFHSGRLLDSYGEFAGEVVADVRDGFREHHAGDAFGTMQEFSEAVVCRCGGDVEVARQQTWFLRYGDGDWKDRAREAVAGLTCIPENTGDQYDHTIDWLDAWPCIRNYGLGTDLPWDDEFVIEPLSDSTIYMAYYTIAHLVDDVPVADLDRTFFDTLFYGAEAVEDGDVPGAQPRDPAERALELREEWDYWYPVDVRCSANDLIQNHLTFFLFHHAELFDESRWPEAITVMGMGLLEGESMSSSAGHVVLPGEAIAEFGADTVRFFLLNSAEPWQDYDWRGDRVGDTRSQLERFWDHAQGVIDRAVPADAGDQLAGIDQWLLSKLQRTVRETTDALESFETRSASQAAFYRFEDHLSWYRRRTDLDRPGAAWTLQQVLRTRLRLLAPFVPFLANELHEQLTGTPAEDANWPTVDAGRESEIVEACEQLVADLTDDIRDIVDVTGTDPEVVRVYVAPDWKREVFETVREVGPDVETVMSEVMSDAAMQERGDAVGDLVSSLAEFVRNHDDERLDALAVIDERVVYDEATEFIGREFDADVEVAAAPGDDADEAGAAVPFRPAVHIE